jgi:ElaB/YqjD/DUF883 family membrane-anchored ribosome-binding protein
MEMEKKPHKSTPWIRQLAALIGYRLVKRSRYIAEDLAEDLAHTIKQYPLKAMGIALGVGAAVGVLISWPLTRQRT